MRALIPYRKHPLVAGTFLLTAAGFLTRIIGFFYRVFLSQAFGEEGMGIYQLTSPVSAMAFSIAVAGLQTAVSRYVAGESVTKDYAASLRVLLSGAALACSLSLGCCLLLFFRAQTIAAVFLREPRCAPLLRILALSLPFAAFHSIAKGYFFGIRNTRLPAVTQLIEQLVRVGSVYLLYRVLTARGQTPSVALAAVGIVLEEAASFFLSAFVLRRRFRRLFPRARASLRKGLGTAGVRLAVMAFPLTLNRVVLNLLQSVESVCLPVMLHRHGMPQSEALASYGVLTGMAMPLVLFPSALIGSLCVLLLPAVAEAQAQSRYDRIRRTVTAAVRCSVLFGAACSVFFLLFGSLAGTLLFHSQLAGKFILTLSFICPFLYLSSTLSSVLNGLGKTGVTFLLSASGLLIRLLFLFLLVPRFGMLGYLWGMLASELALTFATLAAVRRFLAS